MLLWYNEYNMPPEFKKPFFLGFFIALILFGFLAATLYTVAPSFRLAADISSVSRAVSNDASMAKLTSTSLDTTSTAPTPLPKPETPTQYLYKMLVNIDTCGLNKLGKQGWSIVHLGQVTTDVYGYNADCKTKTNYTLDWVVLQLASPSQNF